MYPPCRRGLLGQPNFYFVSGLGTKVQTWCLPLQKQSSSQKGPRNWKSETFNRKLESTDWSECSRDGRAKCLMTNLSSDRMGSEELNAYDRREPLAWLAQQFGILQPATGTVHISSLPCHRQELFILPAFFPHRLIRCVASAKPPGWLRLDLIEPAVALQATTRNG